MGTSDKDQTEEAEELANAVGSTVKEVRELAQFADNLFGNVVSNTLGLLGDKLAYLRFERAIELSNKTKLNLEKRGVDKARYVPVSFGLPLLEKASLEDSDELHDLWANLLANAADPNYDGAIRKNYVSMLADLEPVDASILEQICAEFHRRQQDDRPNLAFAREKVAAAFGLDEDSADASLRNLLRLGLIKPGVIEGGISIGDHLLSSYKDLELFQLTSLGVDFHRSLGS